MQEVGKEGETEREREREKERERETRKDVTLGNFDLSLLTNNVEVSKNKQRPKVKQTKYKGRREHQQEGIFLGCFPLCRSGGSHLGKGHM